MPFGDAGEDVFNPIWNVADAAISVGVIWIIIRQGAYFYKKNNSSRKVDVGSTTIGGDSPVRIQSMTTTNTCDVEASIAQSISLIKAGSELVRLTAPSIKMQMLLRRLLRELEMQGMIRPLLQTFTLLPMRHLGLRTLLRRLGLIRGTSPIRKKV